MQPFRERPLQGRYSCIWLNAKTIAYGMYETGRREVVGIDVGEAETDALWREFLRGLTCAPEVGPP